MAVQSRVARLIIAFSIAVEIGLSLVPRPFPIE